MRWIAGLILFVLVSANPAFSGIYSPEYLDPPFNRPFESAIIIDPGPVTAIMGQEIDDDISISYLNDITSHTPRTKASVEKAMLSEQMLSGLSSKRLQIISRADSLMQVGEEMAVRDLTLLLATRWTGMFVVIVADALILTAEALSIVQAVVAYYSQLISAVDNAEYAYNEMVSESSTLYSELDRMGINSISYSGAHRNEISGLNSEFASINGLGLAAREHSLKSKLSYYTPQESVHVRIITDSEAQVHSILNGRDSALARLISINGKMGALRAGLLAERSTLASLVSARQSAVSAKLSSAESGLGGITGADAVYFGISSLETIDSPSGHLAKARSLIGSAKGRIEEGNFIFSSGAHGYVANSISAHYTALDQLNGAEFEIKEAERKADYMLGIAMERTEAQLQAARTESSSFIPKTKLEEQALSDSKKLVSEAEQMIAGTGTHSERMSKLKSAYAKLVSARLLLSPDRVFLDEASAAAVRGLANLKDTVSKAKADNIDVSYEESFYERWSIALSSGNLDAEELVWVSQQSLALSEQVYLRGSGQYAWLNEIILKAEETEQHVVLLKGRHTANYDKLAQFMGVEGELDPHKSLGNYLVIKGILEGIMLQQSLEMHSLAAESLQFNARHLVLPPNCTIRLDEPCSRSIVVETFSTVKYDGSRPITISIPIGADLSGATVSENPYSLQYGHGSGKLTLLVMNYSPNTNYRIVFNSETVLARSLSTSVSHRFISPKQLIISVEREFSSSGIPHLAVDSVYGHPYSLYLDGSYYGEFGGATVIRKDIQQGRHTILQSHRIINPISADITESALDGSAREILFTLRNEAPIALNDIPVYYEVPVSAPDYVYISSSDCIISKSSYVKSPNSLVMSAVISEMPSGSTCSISLRATVNYDFDRLKDELDSISNDPIAREDPKISAMIDKAKSSLEQLDLPKANTEIMNAKAELDKRMSSAELERSRAAEAERLALEVNSTLSALGAIEDSSVAKIIAKARPYYESSLLEPSLEKRISLLRSAQKELAALDSHLFSEISGLSGRIGKLKERWLYLVGLGYADSIPDEIYLLEQSLSNASRTASLGSPHSYFALSGISSMKDSVQLSEDRAKIAESDSKKWESSLKTSFKSAVSLLKKSLDQLKAACGTSCPQELVSSAESALQLNPSTPQEHAAALSHINKTNSGIQDYVSTIRSSANTALSELRGRISRIGDQKQREILTGRLNELDSLYGKGKYLEVSQSAAALFSAMQPESATDNTLLILGGLALVIVAFVIIKIKEKNSTENAETRRSLRREGG